MAQKIRITSYMRNLGKSLGYAVGDNLKVYNPTIASIAKGTRDTAKSAAQSMKDLARKSSESSRSAGFEEGNSMIDDMLDDLKTGKWYNKERNDKNFEKAMGLDGFDDLDESWGDEDFDDEEGSSAKEIISQNDANTRTVVSSMGQVGSEISRSVGYATAQSAEYIVANSNAANKAMYELNAQGFNQVTSVLLSMNSNLEGIANMGSTLGTHIQNASVFYTNTTKAINEINDSIKLLAERTKAINEINDSIKLLAERTKYLDPNNKDIKNKKGSDRFMVGGFDMTAYVDMVKENFNEQTEFIKSFLGMGKMAASASGTPLQMALTAGIDMAIPKFTKEAMKSFSEYIDDAILVAFKQANVKVKNSSNPLASILGAIFLPQDDFKTSINTGNYEKGAVAWDGIARKSLVEVIPTYLAKIAASLGNDEKYYDYEIGRFVSNSEIKKHHDYELTSRAESAGGEFRKDAKKLAGNNKELNDALDAYFLNAFKKGEGFNDIRKKKKAGGSEYDEFLKEFGLTKDAADLLLSLLSDYSKDPKKRNRAMKYQADVQRGRNSYSDYMRAEEAKGHSIYNHMYSGFNEPAVRVGSGGPRYYGFDSISSGPSGNGPRPSSGGERSNMDSKSKKAMQENKEFQEKYSKGGFYGLSEEEAYALYEADQKDKEMEKTMRGAQGKVHTFIKGLVSKIGGKKAGEKIDLFKTIYEKPFTLIENALGAITNGITELFWGKDGEGGLIDKISKKFEDTWKGIKDKFDEILGNSDKKGMKQAMKDEWGNIVGYAKDKYNNSKQAAQLGMQEIRAMRAGTSAFKDSKSLKQYLANVSNVKIQRENAADLAQMTADYMGQGENSTDLSDDEYEELLSQTANAPKLAKGRKITKSGLAILSRGELVIPSELNPFYHGATNKRSQIANESRIRNKILGFAEGNVSKHGNIIIETDADGHHHFYKQGKDGEKEELDLSIKDNADKAAKALKEKMAGSGPVEAIAAGMDTITGGIKSFMGKLFGDPEKERKKIFDSLGETLGSMDNAKGAMGIGAIAGAGVSVLTGALVGPLAGAAIGAGVGWITKSQKLQDAIFGKEEEDGSYKEGILKGFGKALKDNNFDMAKGLGIGGGLGAAAGLFMGSPLLGLIGGSAIGYVTKSEKAKNALFGNFDENGERSGGIISKELQDKIKKAAPHMAAGGILGTIGALVGGPFGLAGGLIAGSGLGYLASSDKFHEIMFGEKEEGGLLGEIRHKVIDNLNDIFHNTLNAIQGTIKRIGVQATKLLTGFGNKLYKMINNKLGKLTGTLLGGLIKGVGKVAKAPLNIAGKALGAVNTGLKKRNLRKGDAIYDRRLGRNLNAEERLNLREDLKNDKVVDADKREIIVSDDGTTLVYQDNEQEVPQDAALYRMNANGDISKKPISRKKALNLITKNNKMYKTGNKFTKLDEYLEGADKDQLTSAAGDLKDVLKNDTLGIKNRKIERSISELGKGFGAGFGKDSIIAGGIQNKIFRELRKGNVDKAQSILDRADIKDPEVKKNMAKLIDEAGKKINDAINDKGSIDDKKKEILESMGIDPNSVSDADLSTMIDAINNEAKDSRFAPNAENELKSEAADRAKIVDDLNDINDKMDEVINNIQDANSSNGKKKHNSLLGGIGESDEEDSEESGSGSSIYRKWIRKLSGGDSGDKKTEFTDNGPVQYVKSNEGEWVLDKSDSETKETMKKQNAFNKAISSIPSISGLLTGMSGIFGSIKDKLFGSEDGKQEGIFSKLFSSLFGDEGMLSGLVGLFTGKSGLASKLLSGVSLKTIIGGIVGPALFGEAIAGKFDSAFANIVAAIPALNGNESSGNSSMADNTSTTVTLADGSKKEIQVDSNGKFVTDSNGNYVATDGSSVAKDDVVSYSSAGTDTSLSSQLKKNTARGIIMSGSKMGGSVAGKVLSNAKSSWAKMLGKDTAKTAAKDVAKEATKDTAKTLTQEGLNKAGTSALQEAAGIADDAVEKAGEKAITSGLATNILKGIQSGLEKIPSLLSHIPGVKNCAFVKDTSWITTIMEKLTPVVSKLGTKAASVATKVAKIAPFVQAAYIIGKGINAWGDAESILGITEDATTGQKIIAVMIAVVNAAIPVIGDLIPDKVLVNIFMTIAPKIGIDVSSLEEQREAAKKEVDKYNEENGTDYTIEEYNQEVEGRGGIITKTKNKIKSFATSVKEKGLGKTLANTGKNIKNGAVKAVKSMGAGIKKVATTVNDATGFTELLKLAAKGDLKGYLAYDNSDKDDDDESSGIGAMVRKVPLLATKIALFPKALMIMIGSKIVSAVKGMFDKIKNTFSAIKEAEQTGEKLIYSDCSLSEFLDTSEITEDEDNPIGGFAGVLVKMGRLSTLPIMFVKRIGRGIKNVATKIFDTVKSSFTNLVSDEGTLLGYVKDGDPAGLWKSNLSENDEDNPIGGFLKIVNVGQKLGLTVPSALSWVGHKVANVASKIFTTVKDSFVNVVSDEGTILGYVKDGDPAGLWKSDLSENDENNPIGGFLKVVNVGQKLGATIPAAFSWVGHKVASVIGTVKDKVVTGFTDIMGQYTTLKGYSDAGDVSGLMSSEPTDDEENPLNGIMGAINLAQKMTLVIPAGFHWVGNKIKSGIESIVGGIKEDGSSFAKALTSLSSAAEDGNISEVTGQSWEASDDNPISGLFKAGFGIAKAFNVVGAVFNKIISPIKKLVEGITGTVGDIADKIKDIKDDAWSSVTSKVSDMWSGVKSFLTGGASGLLPSGGASFISQRDPRYANQSFAGSTFGAKGCGPAVAAMAANAMGHSMSVDEAIKASKGYQNPNGVSIDYFANALGSKGINTQIISGGSSADMYGKLANGEKMILLGRDPGNMSKDNSPFGPSNHYVLATGLDRNGNVIVNDPELNSARSYSPSILKSASYGISGGSSRMQNYLYMMSGGASSVASQVWYFFRKKGYSEKATAGIMGNLMQETGMKPETKTAVTSGIACWDKQNGVYPLEVAAKKAGKDWKDLSFQLGYLESGLSSALKNYSGRTVHKYANGEWCWWPKKVTIEQFKKLDNINDATEIFERCYERASKPMIDKRKKYANQFYKQFTGKEGDPITTSSYDSSDDSSSSSSGFTTLLSAASNLGTVFSDAFGKIFGTSDDSSSDSSSESGSVDTSTDTSQTTGGVAKTAPKGDGTAASFVKIAQSQLGVTEGNDNITDYGKFTGANGQPWCASFVSWCMDKAFNGDKKKRNKALRGGISASVSGLQSNFSKAKALVGKNQAKAGDIVIYKNAGASHTGLVEAVDADGKVHTIEGNTSGDNSYNRNGGMVARKSFYPASKKQLTGFGRPLWSSGSGYMNYNDIALASGGSSGLLLSARPGSQRYGTTMVMTPSGNLVPVRTNFSGGASSIGSSDLANQLKSIKSSALKGASNGTVSTDLVSKLIESITNILNAIADNTSYDEKIYNVLSSYLKSGGGSNSSSKDQQIVVNKNTINTSNGGSTDVDSSIATLAGVLAELAKG